MLYSLNTCKKSRISDAITQNLHHAHNNLFGGSKENERVPGRTTGKWRDKFIHSLIRNELRSWYEDTLCWKFHHADDFRKYKCRSRRGHRGSFVLPRYATTLAVQDFLSLSAVFLDFGFWYGKTIFNNELAAVVQRDFLGSATFTLLVRTDIFTYLQSTTYANLQ